MDKRYLIAFVMGASSLALGIVVVRLLGLGSGLPVLEQPLIEPPTRIHNLSGPFTHKNLTVYLVHGSDVLSGKTPLTLAEAMERRIVKVHETSDVNELEIENVSTTDEVYVQAGDIVKGGKQDRVLTVDLIVPTRSGRMPISSFCVEQGRWTARGNESTAEFNSAYDMAPGIDLKVATKHTKSQTEVWNKVGEQQTKLSASTNTNTTSSVSRSSLPLTLRNEAVQANTEDYIDALQDILRGKHDVIGFVFAINGRINSADTYGSNELFAKLWPRLLKATAIEALGESHSGSSTVIITADPLNEFLSKAELGESVSEEKVTDRIRMITRESDEGILIESRDRERTGWLHRNYLRTSLSR
jgi:hypothetical protein